MPARAQEHIASAALQAVARAGAYLESARLDLGAPAPGERRWTRLAHARAFDAWLIAWGPDSAIPAHDHGDSAAALMLLEGSLVEFSRESSDPRHWVARELAPGIAVEVPTRRIHHVANQGISVAASLHVYSPPLADLTFHDDVGSRQDFGSRQLVTTGATA